MLRAPAALIAVAVLAAATPQQVEPVLPPLAITHVAVIDTATGAAIPDMTVVVDNGRIASVGKGEGPRGAEVVDGRGKFLMPGLWDMHVHLSLARVSALPGLVANGVTSVRDMGSDLAELDRWRGQVADNVVTGPSIVRAGPILNGQESNRYHLVVGDASEARMAVRTLRKVGVDFIKLHRRTSRDAYFAIAAEAKQLRLPFSGHVPITVSPLEAADAGQASIEHTETLFEGTFATAHEGRDFVAEIANWRTTDAPALFAAFVRNGTRVDPTLVAQDQLVRTVEATSPDARARYIAASARLEAEKTLGADMRKIVRERPPLLKELQAVTGLMHRAGVVLVAGTDTSIFHPPGFSLHDELALLVASGLSAADALRAATVNAAAMFPSENAGIVAPGKRADLVLLDANPLEDIRHTQRISAVILRGRLLNKQSLDRLLAEAARLAAIN
jgi:imidazolonepropionase-like amidohydrolase